MVTLLPMTADDWEVRREWLIRDYAADKVRAGTWPTDEAVARAEGELRQLLPQGVATPGHELRTVVTDDGATVGSIWLGPSGEVGCGACFLFDIEVRPEARGRGYGRAALLALEPLARDLGYEAIRLHVFGDNVVARNLYRSSGYVETDVNMSKSLG